MNLPELHKKSKYGHGILKFNFNDRYKLVYITVGSFFVGNILSAVYGFMTIIPLFSFARLVAIMIAISYLVQDFFFRSIFPMKRMEYLMVSVFGAAPVLTSLFLILNFYIHTDRFAKDYKINEISYDGGYIYFRAEGLPCEKYPELCKVDMDDITLMNGDHVQVTMARGICGYKVILKIEKK